jgi:hypothetical protein
MYSTDTYADRVRQLTLGHFRIILQKAKHAKMRVLLQLGALAGHFWDFLRLPHKDCPRGALLDAKVMMRIVSISLIIERYQVLRTQTRGKCGLSRYLRHFGR